MKDKMPPEVLTLKILKHISMFYFRINTTYHLLSYSEWCIPPPVLFEGVFYRGACSQWRTVCALHMKVASCDRWLLNTSEPVPIHVRVQSAQFRALLWRNRVKQHLNLGSKNTHQETSLYRCEFWTHTTLRCFWNDSSSIKPHLQHASKNVKESWNCRLLKI